MEARVFYWLSVAILIGIARNGVEMPIGRKQWYNMDVVHTWIWMIRQVKCSSNLGDLYCKCRTLLASFQLAGVYTAKSEWISSTGRLPRTDFVERGNIFLSVSSNMHQLWIKLNYLIPSFSKLIFRSFPYARYDKSSPLSQFRASERLQYANNQVLMTSKTLSYLTQLLLLNFNFLHKTKWYCDWETKAHCTQVSP